MKFRAIIAVIVVVSGLVAATPAYACEWDEIFNFEPENGATVSTTPTLVMGYIIPEEDPCTHWFTLWVIATDPLLKNIVFDSDLDEENLYEITIPSGILQPRQTYYWAAITADILFGPGKSSTPTSFTVRRDGGSTPAPGTSSIEKALDTNGSGMLDDAEIQRAIQIWILGSEVEGTNNQTINDEKMLALLRIWILGTRVS
jgi:hypothetical protein